MLKEFGLPPAALGWSLFAFNLGVEIGQLLIVPVVAWALTVVRRNSEDAARQIALGGSIGVFFAGVLIGLSSACSWCSACWLSG